MSSPPVDDLLLDDDNEEKFGRHGLTARQILQVLENEYVIVRNRKDRRGLYLLIGRDNGGTCIAVPIESTHTPGLWRPITAWRCKDHERAKLD